MSTTSEEEKKKKKATDEIPVESDCVSRAWDDRQSWKKKNERQAQSDEGHLRKFREDTSKGQLGQAVQLCQCRQRSCLLLKGGETMEYGITLGWNSMLHCSWWSARIQNTHSCLDAPRTYGDRGGVGLLSTSSGACWAG